MKNPSKYPFKEIVIVGVGLVVLAFTWPWEAQKAETQEKPKPAPETQEVESQFEEEPGEIKWKIQEKREDETTEAIEGAVPVAKAVPIYKPAFKPVTPLPSRPYKPVQTAQTVQPPIDISILNLQKQISDIIKLNESIKASQRGQVTEIQKIIDQARIHQRILTELKEGEEKGEVKPADAEALLRQEKVRLIQEQTEQNKEFIDEIEKALEAERASESKPISELEIQSESKEKE